MGRAFLEAAMNADSLLVALGVAAAGAVAYVLFRN